MTSKKTKEAQRRLKGKPIATAEESEKYSEIFIFMYDSGYEANERRLGRSTLNKEAYLRILKKYQEGHYPEHLKYLARNELRLKHEEIAEELYKETLEMIEKDQNDQS